MGPAAVLVLEVPRALVPDLVPGLAPAAAHDPARAPDLEAKAVVAQDLVDVPRANLALQESRVPSLGRVPEVTVRSLVTSRMIVRNLVTSQ